MQCWSGRCDFICADRTRVEQDAVCDQVEDCPSGEDEPCVDRFSCPEDPRTSLPFEQVCDGSEQCPTGGDEAECPNRTTYFICDDGNQILFPFWGSSCWTRYPRQPVCDDGSGPDRPCPTIP